MLYFCQLGVRVITVPTPGRRGVGEGRGRRAGEGIAADAGEKELDLLVAVLPAYPEGQFDGALKAKNAGVGNRTPVRLWRQDSVGQDAVLEVVATPVDAVQIGEFSADGRCSGMGLPDQEPFILTPLPSWP